MLGKAANATEVGCWAHARRRFFRLKDSDARAGWPLQLIQKLYRVEKRATRDDLDPDERLALRKKRSRKDLDKLGAWLKRTYENEPPASAMADACGYSIRHWIALSRFLEDGRLPLDNNLCELQIRTLAVGRKNYLFAGSDNGARRAATLCSLLRTAALHNVDSFVYLTDVMQKIADDWPADRIDELLPDAWAAAREGAATSSS